jgi:hypothetical protein
MQFLRVFMCFSMVATMVFLDPLPPPNRGLLVGLRGQPEDGPSEAGANGSVGFFRRKNVFFSPQICVSLQKCFFVANEVFRRNNDFSSQMSFFAANEFFTSNEFVRRKNVFSSQKWFFVANEFFHHK